MEKNQYSILKQIKNLKLKIKNSRPQTEGFTLVELLVVVGITAMAMAILMPNFMGVRTRARDTQRKREVAEVQKALELFKLDQNPPAYPTTGALGGDMCGTCWSSSASCTGNVYMQKVPCDPASAAPTPYLYNRGANDTLTYTLTTCLENNVDSDKDSATVAQCSAAGLSSYTLKEP